MYRIVDKQPLNGEVTRMVIEAPRVAKAGKPGQFLILRIDERGERVPLTLAACDSVRGTVTIIFQKVGLTTHRLDELDVGGSLRDVAGPLGRPTEIEGVKRAALLAGGLGVAIAYPIAKALKAHGADVHGFLGFRSRDLIILEDEFAECCSTFDCLTDDGSNGRKGFVTDGLRAALESGERFDRAFAIGPLPMMKAVCGLTGRFSLPTIVSMNSIMIDGTGMCGCCRLTVGGRVKFACVDGPDFDGSLVDFDEAMRRGSLYRDEERRAMHECRLVSAAIVQGSGVGEG
ncbi:MAG: sulfide/dihydroorotate dehydrogenase-like FAD/NAD-binding protein [Oscillospiraceae bacterium]|jgi:ferredoxin--NADP+ reductase|nr:sulfide/dihydroorotate dehydrogenase-like FAD/NAD-binding protein [Oscillospiraceae bacterium]